MLPTIVRISSVLLLAAVLGGCSLFSSSLFETRNMRQASGEESQELLQQLEQKSAQIVSARSLWEVAFKRMFSSDRVRQSLVFSRPDKLRAEYFERATNQLLFIMVMNQETLKAFDYRDNTAFIGSATRHDLERLISIPLAPEEIMLFFMGAYAVPKDIELLSVQAWVDDRSPRAMLEFVFFDETQVQLLVDRDADLTLQAARVRIKGSDDVTLTYEYQAGDPLPTKLSLLVQKRSVDIVSNRDRVTLNPELRNEDILFDIQFPPGVPVYRLLESN